MAGRMGRVSPINSCHTLLVSDHGDTISESDNKALTSNNTTLHFTLGSVCSECARCLLSRCHIKLVAVVLFTSYFRLEQGQTHLSSSFRPINTINTASGCIYSLNSPLSRLGNVPRLKWLAAGISRSTCLIPKRDWLWSYDFIRRIHKKHSRARLVKLLAIKITIKILGWTQQTHPWLRIQEL